MATIALKAAKRNIVRATYFLEIHEGTQDGPGTPSKQRRELPRGAVVFALGACDAYLSEVAAEVMVAQFERGRGVGKSGDVLKKVQQAVPTLAIRLAVADPDVDRSALLREAIVNHFYNEVSNHGAKAVSSTVDRMGESSNAVWSAVETADGPDPQQRLNKWTTDRHAIVHRGQSPQINREPARECVKLVEVICTQVDKVAVVAKRRKTEE